MFCLSVSAIMEAMRESWNDDRLDGLRERVDAGFTQVDQRFAEVDKRFAEVDKRFARVEARLDERFDRLDDKIDRKIDAAAFELRLEMKEGFHQLNSRFDAMQQTIIRVGGGLIGVLVAGFIAAQF